MIADFAAHLAERGHAERTIKSYCDSVASFARWFAQSNGCELTRATFTQTDVREYRQHLSQRGQKPASINSALAALRVLARWWETPISVAGVKQQPLAPRWLDKREQAALLREAQRQVNSGRRKSGRNLAIIQLLLNTGLRVSELCDLEPSNVTAGPRSGTLTTSGKGEKRRTVALNREARAALAGLPLPIGLKPGQVQRAIAEVGRRAGLEVTPHVLRHTFAHNLSGHVQADRIAALLGHSDLRTTARYTAPGQQDLQEAVETLE